MDPTTTYYVLLIWTGLISAIFTADILVFHPGRLSLSQRVYITALALWLVYLRTVVRRRHNYYQGTIKYNCVPARGYPHKDPFGYDYIKELSKSEKDNTVLERLQKLLDTVGHTYFHTQFLDSKFQLVTDDVENIKAILATKHDDWGISTARIEGFLSFLGPHSIFTNNGKKWQHSRALIRPAFRRDELADFTQFDRHIANLIEALPKDESYIDVQELLSWMNVDLSTDFMFGHSTQTLTTRDPEGLKFGVSFDRSVLGIGRRIRLGKIAYLVRDAKFEDAVKFVRQYISKYVTMVSEEHSKNQGSKDEDEKRKYVFLPVMLESGLPRINIEDAIVSLVIAGRDTSTSVVTYLLAQLARHPEVVAKLREEIVGVDAEEIGLESITNLKYLNWCLKEALRLNPPIASNTREAFRDTVLPVGGGPDGKSPIFVPKGTMVRFVTWAMHRRKDIYGPDAEEFRPERWKDLKLTWEHLPFGGGPRICPGQQFALTAMALTIFRIFQHFKTVEPKVTGKIVQQAGASISIPNGCWIKMAPV